MAGQSEKFHTNRRAFIMWPGRELIVSSVGCDISHNQMFSNLGVAPSDVPRFMEIIPRGYFMDGEVCVYQGYDMTPGAVWEITPAGAMIVHDFLPALCHEFKLNCDTNLYLGVRVGVVGQVWDKIRKTKIGDFSRTQ
ncbi:MAG: hypothetical protein J6T57_00805 [Alphaproteobacteria bacterium]|nr:hypothetical protein [Alphaproteobacteria bacterium]